MELPKYNPFAAPRQPRWSWFGSMFDRTTTAEEMPDALVDNDIEQMQLHDCHRGPEDSCDCDHD